VYPSIRIRMFDDRDLDQILALEKECFTDPFDERVFNNLFKYEHLFLVAEVCGSVAGYILALIREGGAEIATVAVAPLHRRKGVAGTLFNELEKHLRSAGIERLILEVRVSNQRALHLYKKLGFDVESTILGFYSDGEDAYLMCKQLNST